MNLTESDAGTLVLVHGGDFLGSCWDLMLPHLQNRALAADLPGRGGHPGDLTTMTTRVWADSVVSDMDSAGIDKAVIVGHSLGGVTLNALALHHHERIASLVFVACPFPEEGGCCAQACTPDICQGMKAAWDTGVRELPRPERAQAIQMFGNDMSAALIERMCADMVPESLGVFMEPLQLAGLRRGIPTLYVKLLRDRASPPDIQDRAIANIKPDEVRRLDSGHMAMYSQPENLAGILDAWIERG